MADTILSIENLSKKYQGKVALNSTNLKIKNGEFVALVGQSGGGKSTLLRLIAGLEPMTSGTISQNNQLIHGINSNTRVMFQDDRLLPWKTVRENITFKKPKSSEAAEAVNQLLERVELQDFADAYPASLSGGQRQRVALARALFVNPEILLLDEPLGALDALTRSKMQKLILDLWQERKMTVILVTHDVHEATKMANRIYVVKNNKIEATFENQLTYPRTDATCTNLSTTILNKIIDQD